MAKQRIPDLLDIDGVAQRMGVSRQWIDTLRNRNELPKPDVTLGQSPGWLIPTIDKWLEGRARRRRREGVSS